MASCIVPFPSEEVNIASSNWHIALCLEYSALIAIGSYQLFSSKEASSGKRLWPFRTVLLSLVILVGFVRGTHFGAYAALQRGEKVPLWLFFDGFSFAGFILDFMIKNLIAMFFLECALELCKGTRHPEALQWIRRGICIFLIIAGVVLLGVRIRVNIDNNDMEYQYICYARSSVLFIAGSGYVVACAYYLRILHRIRIKDSRKRQWTIRVGFVFALLVASFYSRGVLGLILTNLHLSNFVNDVHVQGRNSFVIFTCVDIGPLIIVLLIISSVLKVATFSDEELLSEPFQRGFDDLTEDTSTRSYSIHDPRTMADVI